MTKLVYFILISLFIFNSCNQTTDEKEGVKKPELNEGQGVSVEERIVKKILNLPEVKRCDQIIDSISGHKKRVEYVLEKPTETNADYYIMVGYNGERQFEVYYHFFVNPENMEIKIEDVLSGGIIKLDDWRKQNN